MALNVQTAFHKYTQTMVLNFLMIKWFPGPITLNDPKIDTKGTDCPNTDLANYLG